MAWLSMETALKDEPIIYLARDPKPLEDPYFVGRATWRDPDEGVDGGWWDDSISDYVFPVGWLPYQDPRKK